MLEFCYTKKYTVNENGEATFVGQARNEFTQHYHAARIATQYGISGMQKYALTKIADLIPSTFELLMRPITDGQHLSPAFLSLQFLQYVVPTWFGSKSLIDHAPCLPNEQPALRNPISVAICKGTDMIRTSLNDVFLTQPAKKVEIWKGIQNLCVDFETFGAEMRLWALEIARLQESIGG
jgi:hypothetical protein